MVTLVVVVAGLGAVETGLRIADYGHATSAFVEKEHLGKRFLVYNNGLFRRFFARIPSEVWDSSEFVVPAAKPREAYRVFIFGGGQANGWPAPMYGFWRILEVMLRERHPDIPFAFYNASFGFLDSHVIREAAAACASLEPDLFVVYAGGNEFIGPFGPAHPMTIGQRTPPMPGIRAYFALCHWRTFQWCADAARRTVFRWFPAKQTGTDPRMEDRVYRHLEANLDAVCRSAERAGAAVVLCTEGVNLRDWPPDRSFDGSSLSATEQNEYQHRVDQGLDLERAGAYDEALAHYRQAAEITDSDAQLAFRMGQCLWKSGEYEGARTCFETALERDSKGFSHAKDRAIQVVERVARRHADRGVYLADARRLLAERSPHGVPGIEFFVDQVHLSFEGSHVVAEAALAPAEQALQRKYGATVPIEATPPASVDTCRRRLGLHPMAIVGAMEGSVSFLKTRDTSSLGDANAAMARLEQLRAAALSATPADVIEELRAALAWTGNDLYLQAELVFRLFTREWFNEALVEAQALAEAFPEHRLAQRLRGIALARAGRDHEAIKAFEELLALYPDDDEARLEIAEQLREQPNEARRAIRLCREVAHRDPENARAYWIEAQALATLGLWPAAVDASQRAIAATPGNEEPYARFDQLLAKQDRPDQRVAEWKRLVEERPGDALAVRYLAYALHEQGAFEAEVSALDRAVAATPDDGLLRLRLAAALVSAGDFDRARQLGEEVLAEQPDNPHVCMELGRAWEGAGDWAQAAGAYRAAMDRTPELLEAYDALDAVLTRQGGPQERVAEWRRIVEAHPEIGRAHFLLGRALDEAGERHAAIAAYRQAIQRQSADPAMHVALGTALYALGRYTEAVEPLRNALATNPEIPHVRPMLIMSLCESGNHAAAWQEVEACRDRGIEVPTDLMLHIEKASASTGRSHEKN
ncbi:MAG TPA: tetratricopeptide repeat protein [Candidatus Hydrogenedentes bacterium]|nr:tetratricopeptide repeat protein [Candidatus Hydrogenedentota bacterium]HPG68636.1 tetratricopeptide repeat protein [Candidatus Hydrogenedentota bacterium]